jgi:hypothetical protein
MPKRKSMILERGLNMIILFGQWILTIIHDHWYTDEATTKAIDVIENLTEEATKKATEVIVDMMEEANKKAIDVSEDIAEEVTKKTIDVIEDLTEERTQEEQNLFD